MDSRLLTIDYLPMNGKFFKQSDLSWSPAPLGMDVWHSGPKQTGAKDLVFIEVTIEPGKFHSFHHHPNQEEIIYVLEGKIQQWIEQESKELITGESAFIPAGVVHATFNTFDQPARFIAILSPCMGEEGYEVEDVFEQEPWKSLAPL